MPGSLKGAPGDAPLFPGRVLAEKSWQLWLGCPEPPGLCGLSAKAGAAHARVKLVASSTAGISFLIFGPPCRRWTCPPRAGYGSPTDKDWAEAGKNRPSRRPRLRSACCDLSHDGAL